MYKEAEDLLLTDPDPYKGTILQDTILEALGKHYSPQTIPKALPLAHRFKKGPEGKPDESPLNFWTGPYEILGEKNYNKKNKFFLKVNITEFVISTW